MRTPIGVETLRQWLDEHRPVAVLDVRTNEDRAQWFIPGSLHVNALEALKAGKPGPLATLSLPSDQPVVTVCGAGRLSQTAADLLTQRGLDARSLAGGMKAWSLAWNTADVVLPGQDVHVVQVRRTGKGCLSYLVGSAEDAAVIDASLPTETYLHLARAHGWRIRFVLETHVHADHVSRARQLAVASGARLLLPAQDRVRFEYSPITHGERVAVGAAAITAHATPGHTPESTSYLLNDVAVLTGDTLFTNGLGRPDLHTEQDGARIRARALYQSLVWLRSLPPSTLVLPGHSSEPVLFDGRPIAASIGEIDEWLSSWLASEAAFVDRVVSRLPPTPPNFARIVELNERGDLRTGDTTDLEAGANRCAVA
jgi:glyoxylase-like metal-dependent hydrolase (beta-lactamase superfamily II)/rhodanese-related sulfurtransferase